MRLEIMYIELCAADSDTIHRLFGEQFLFTLCYTRENDRVKQCLWKQGNIKFTTTTFKHINSMESEDLQNTSWSDEFVMPHIYMSQQKKGEHAGSMYNVVLRVHDINACIDHVKKCGGTVLKPIQEIKDANGHIHLAVVKSCIGNIIHTIIESTNYHGSFLPQFNEVGEIKTDAIETSYLRFVGMDHLAFAINVGHSQEVIEWYERFFMMQRYYVSSQDSEGGGFVVEVGDIGLRLRAISPEVGLMSRDSAVKFVLAESLHANSSDQISTFIREHGGEGLQHIGLMTDDIVSCIAGLTRNGVNFTEPPPTYYSEIGKLKEIEAMGEDAHLMEQHGILIDADDPLSNGYLMQKFTKPIFGVDTFFFEIIQRKNGSRGFGAGNVTALWKSLQAYLQQRNRSIDSH